MSHSFVPDKNMPANTLLNEMEAKELLKEAEIPTVETRLARTKAEVVAYSREIGFTAMMKVISPDIRRKTEAGGVTLSIQQEYDSFVCKILQLIGYSIILNKLKFGI